MLSMNAHPECALFSSKYGSFRVQWVYMFPLLPSKIDSELEGLKDKVISLAAGLGGGLNPKVIQAISEFMLSVNSYYTNAMEGNPSFISDIQKALNNELSTNKILRNYQLEHLAHISTQKKMIERLSQEKDLDICSTDFLCWLHKEFYSRLPEEMHFALTREGRKVPVLAGELRDKPSSVGQHLPPEALDAIQINLQNFQRGYSPSSIEENKKVFAFACSHHRLLWIHPFRDGNGRVARLFTIAYQYRTGIESHGLWTVIRAFARRRSEYDLHLSLADQPRRNDFDGRGPLSEENLVLFCKYFLRECVDQIEFMRSLLDLHNFEARFKKHLALLQSQKIISAKSVLVLQELFYKGEIERGEVQRICGVERRRATEIIKNLLDQSLVHSDSPHGKIMLFISDETASQLFPKLV